MLSNHEEKIVLAAEWEMQTATLLVWPHYDSDWRKTINEIQQTYLQISKAIYPYQRLLILYRDEKQRKTIVDTFTIHKLPTESYTLIHCDYNDTWCRDYGPLIIKRNGAHEIINFNFNGWGSKYNAELDNQVTQQLYNKGLFSELKLTQHDFLLEGGSIDTDGQGTFLTTSNCLLKRHPDKNRTELELILKKYLGANKVHWLEHAEILGDDTDGHIDMLARFVNRETIVYSTCKNKEHPNHATLKKMEEELSRLRQANGEAYQLVPIELPDLKTWQDKILPASYINFIFINQAVIVPTYNDPQDKHALDQFKRLFPQREIINIDATALIKQNGSLHCATMQIPANINIEWREVNA